MLPLVAGWRFDERYSQLLAAVLSLRGWRSRARTCPGSGIRQYSGFCARCGSARAPTLPHLEGPSECTQMSQFGAAENGEPDAEHRYRSRVICAVSRKGAYVEPEA